MSDSLTTFHCLIVTTSLGCRCYCSHFSWEEFEPQRGQVNFPGSLPQVSMVVPGLHLRVPAPGCRAVVSPHASVPSVPRAVLVKARLTLHHYARFFRDHVIMKVTIEHHN